MGSNPLECRLYFMLNSQNLLLYILIFPIIGILFLLIIPVREERLLKFVSLNFSCIAFIVSLMVWGGFNKSIGFFQYALKFFWFPFLTLNFSLGVDGISIFFFIVNYDVNSFMYFNQLE